MQNFFIVFIAVLLFSCSDSTRSKGSVNNLSADTFKTENLIVDTSQEEGWGADIKLSLYSVKQIDSNTSYIIKAKDASGDLGFEFAIPAVRKANPQGMRINSLGEISDNFLKKLSQLYKVSINSSTHFISSTKITFINLDEFAKKELGNYPDDSSGTMGLKVFFDSGPEDDYGEIYFNVNEKKHWVEIKEKDDGYRKQVIKALTNH
jgi:major membrane immunogen (membrane-anchored lipoprotein)